MYLGATTGEGPTLNYEVGAPPPPKKTGFAAFLENLPTIFGGVTQVILANKIAKINLERMRQGLPPLDASQVQAAAPSAGVRVGLSPELTRILIFGGLGIGALVAFSILRSKKRGR